MNQKEFHTLRNEVADHLISIAEDFKTIQYDDFKTKCWNYRGEEDPEMVALYSIFHVSEYHANYVINSHNRESN